MDWTQAVTRRSYLDLARAEGRDLLELLRDLDVEEGPNRRCAAVVDA